MLPARGEGQRLRTVALLLLLVQWCTRTPRPKGRESRVGSGRSLGRKNTALLGTNPCTVTDSGLLCFAGKKALAREPCGSPRPQQALPGGWGTQRAQLPRRCQGREHSTTQLGRAREEGGSGWPLWVPLGPWQRLTSTWKERTLEVRNESRRRPWEATNKQTNKQRCYAKRETRNQWFPAQQNTRLCQCQHEASERASEPSEHHDLTAFRKYLYVLVECGIIALDLVPRLHEEALKPLKSTANLELHYRTRRRGRLARDH